MRTLPQFYPNCNYKKWESKPVGSELSSAHGARVRANQRPAELGCEKRVRTMLHWLWISGSLVSRMWFLFFQSGTCWRSNEPVGFIRQFSESRSSIGSFWRPRADQQIVQIPSIFAGNIQ